MSNPKRLSAKESDAARAELDSLRNHCLSLVSTSTQLGVDLRDSTMLCNVRNLSELVKAAERVGTELPKFHESLNSISAKQRTLLSKPLDADNLMRVISIAQEYENWLHAFGNRVTPSLDMAYSIIDQARNINKETTNV